MIRGSPLAIPIEKSLLYVQPLYLAAEQGSLPELKRVIAAFGSQIAMEETLDQSLQKIFGAKPAREATTPAAPVATANGGRDLAHQVLDHFQRSQERLRQGNWGGYGEELKKTRDPASTDATGSLIPCVSYPHIGALPRLFSPLLL